MPELPEVETVRRGLTPALEGARLKTVTLGRPDLRFPFPPRFRERLEGARLIRLGRRAKYLLGEMDTGESLLMHLGMSGSFRVDGAAPGDFAHPRNLDPKHDHVIFETGEGSRVTFNDPRRFGFMTLIASGETSPYLDGLGPEPLSNAFNGPVLHAAFRGRRTPVKAALLDQRIVAGLGNIYVCEALFRANISPRRRAANVGAARCEKLAAAVKAVLSEAIEAGGSSLRDYALTDGTLGYFQHSFSVYGREGEPCRACAAPVTRIVQAGRSSFFCSSCQR